MSSKKNKVVIVEDERPLARALQLKFEKLGIDSMLVENGQALFEKLEKEKFDLILLDLIMPEMSGFQVLENLKEKGIKTPVMIISNLRQQEDIDKCLKAGAVDYMVKSNVMIVDIVKRVQKFLSK